MKVKHGNKEYNLRGSEDFWTPARFDFLKKEARDKAKLVVIDEKGEKHLIPMSELERVEDV